MEKKVLIVGGGVGGVAAALTLANSKFEIRNSKLRITLVNPTPHFEYHATLYRVFTGHSPLESCIPLREIFPSPLSQWRGGIVDVVEDYIISVDFGKNTAVGKSGSHYHYDYIVLALGAETAYFDIPGLRELSFSLKSTSDAIRLNRHLHESFSKCGLSPDTEDKKCNTHIVVVGGGATGVEVAGALALYTKKLAKKHGVDQALVKVDLITSPDRLVPELPEIVSHKIKERLESLGVGVTLGNRVLKEDVEHVYLKDAKMNTKTVIWAAGVKGNSALRKWGLPVDKQGKVVVDEYLRPNFKFQISNFKFKNVFIIGDSAASPHSGMAKTAWYDGLYVADSVARSLREQALMPYKPVSLWHFLPAGQKWVAAVIGGFKVYGRVGWILRRVVDFIFFTKILSLGNAINAFRSDKALWENCPICSDK